MFGSLALIFLGGLALAALCRRLRLPALVGLLLWGAALGPCGLDLLDPLLLELSPQLRQMALVVILLKAGLSLELSDLKRVGRPAVLLSFVPACCETLGYVLLAPLLLGAAALEGAILGAVLAAVSPAVVTPRMVDLMEQRRGTAQGIPQMILAGASCDDVFVIVLFSTFTAMAGGQGARWQELAGIPLSILLGAGLGAAAGWLLHRLFTAAGARGQAIRGSYRLLLLLASAFLLVWAEDALKGRLPLSGLLAVMAMACVLRKVSPGPVSQDLAEKTGRLWLAAEVLLFVLVGAAVDLRYTLRAGPLAALVILLALVFRSAGVLLSTAGTPLTRRERLFCVLAYLPKATVQAAIGGVPLALGLPCGQLVLSVAVLGILITAPLGALAIDRAAPRLLRQEPRQP